jgi:endonuclease/exonuclease/phosphatase family metal-dependent hydrolase
MALSVATWNTEWATPGNDRGRRIAAILRTAGADIAVVTEGVRGLLPVGGSVVDAGGDWGYGLKADRRKVIVWSRYPLTLDLQGVGGATDGRLAVATAATPAGPLRILGVCIPWRDAHVNTGRSDARPWSEHMDYLDRLEVLLTQLDDGVPTVIAGDFNQRIPRGRQPMPVATRLNDVLANWKIHTAGVLPNGPHIDHIATDGQFVLESVRDWPGSDPIGRLSDHAGVACRLGYADQRTQGACGGSVSKRRKAQGLCDVTLTPTDTPTPPHTPTRDRLVAFQGTSTRYGALNAELRAEIEEVLRRSGDGLSHGATFRLREQGLSDAQIATERGVSIGTTRGFLRSLDALLNGMLPTTKSLALKNSYVYRELLNHPRSEDLDSYVKAQLAKLKSINPNVRFDPLQTRAQQYRVGVRKQKTAIDDSCGKDATVGIAAELFDDLPDVDVHATPDEPSLPPDWQAVYNEAVSDAERNLIRALAGAGTAVPALGYETEDGEVIDLAWADARVGVTFDGAPTAEGWILCPADVPQILAALRTNGVI